MNDTPLLPRDIYFTQKREMLVGMRFTLEAWNLYVRPGLGSVVIDAEPLSGPIYLWGRQMNNDRIAKCEHCGQCSDALIRIDAIKRWAHGHRCS